MNETPCICHGVKAARVPAPHSSGAPQVVPAGSPTSAISYLVVFEPPMFTLDADLHHI